MIKYILKKLLQMIPMLLVISLIVFLGLRATGIDPITYMVSMEVQAAVSGNCGTASGKFRVK